MTLSTPRLTLEPLEVAHADELVDVLGDPALYEYTGGAPPTVDELRARYTRQVVGRSADGSQLWLNWVVRHRTSGAAVGVVQATVTGRAGEGRLVGRRAALGRVVGRVADGGRVVGRRAGEGGLAGRRAEEGRVAEVPRHDEGRVGRWADDRRVAEVAWVIGWAHQRQEYARESAHAMLAWLLTPAADTRWLAARLRPGRARVDAATGGLGCDVVVAHIHPGHEGSMAVARSLALRPTAQLVDGEVRWERRR